MSISANILRHIENFTAQRDRELLAFSLLKSIGSMLSPDKATIISLDHRSNPTEEISLVGKKCQCRYSNIIIDQSILDSLNDMNQASLTEFTRSYDELFLSIHLLKQHRQSTQFLVLTLRQPLEKPQLYVIKGMLSIYSNFTSLLIEAQTDELTGLMNRKTFEESVAKLCNQGHSVADEDFENDKRHYKFSNNWLVIIDVDHFKNINDQYGHLYGDEVLILLSRLLKQSFRSEDLLFRFGGEEFVIILRSLSRDHCEAVLERLRQQICNTKFAKVPMVSVSMGVVELDLNVFHATLVDYADQALYYSKRNGRNRITFFEDMVKQGIAKEQEVESGDVDYF
ncbi:GGDEF domain-containing protein [Aliiglaciecola sp. CAU 1673]|uniref:GGDEF domain-containing protein n=1 Tax=Aliiglaciecola sp. CAU 1673 TaxID=3032595 RepID=UPI0023D98100|nr:GGDEF domain-containing protein [Aliiglaciecola sp. CAU 1673]MDF2176904.1 GGDEF domain-containing protein [Aliiglaciecola sp. CAU 1673]